MCIVILHTRIHPEVSVVCCEIERWKRVWKHCDPSQGYTKDDAFVFSVTRIVLGLKFGLTETRAVTTLLIPTFISYYVYSDINKKTH